MTGAKAGYSSNRTSWRGLRKGTLVLALLLALPDTTRAIDVDYEVGVAVRHSDNINLSETNPIEDTVRSPTLFFEAAQVGRRIQLAARGDVEYLDYASNTFENEFRGRFAGRLNFNVLPERLDFVVQDYLSRQPIDQLAAFNPGNQQQINVFVAGPSLYTRFDGVTRGQFDLRYSNSYAEEDEDFDSDRYTAAARVLREMSSTSSLSANLEATDVRFQLEGGASDYRRYDGYFGSAVERNNVDVELDLGYSRLELDDGFEESSPLARAAVNWRLTPRSLLATTVRYHLTDATQSLVTPLDIDANRRPFADFIVPDVQVEPNVFRERLIRARYRHTGDRLTLQLVPYHRRMRYVEDLVESQDRTGALVLADYRVRPRLTLSLEGGREKREFVRVDREDTDTTFSVSLAHRFTRKWTGRIGFQRRDRDSSAIGRSYDSNAVLLSMTYQR